MNYSGDLIISDLVWKGIVWYLPHILMYLKFQLLSKHCQMWRCGDTRNLKRNKKTYFTEKNAFEFKQNGEIKKLPVKFVTIIFELSKSHCVGKLILYGYKALLHKIYFISHQITIS